MKQRGKSAGVTRDSSASPRVATRPSPTRKRSGIGGKRRPLTAALAWAREEFRSLTGHLARVKCWITLAALAADRPAGTVTGTFSTDAERQAMYGQLAHHATTAAWLGEAAHRATARRCAKAVRVFVPVDGSSLQITDTQACKGTGRVGSHAFKARGVQVMNAIAVLDDGTPVGMCAQEYWTRAERKVRTHRRKRSVGQKETRHWLAAIQHTVQIFKEEAPACTPWFQLDRGGDAADVLAMLLDADLTATVRAAHDRRTRRHRRTARVWSVMRRLPALGTYAIEVPAGRKRAARTANMVVRATTLTLELPAYKGGTRRRITLGAVYAVETGTTPKGEPRIEWLLYSTQPVQTIEDALLILRGYKARWAVEEFHKTWKSGLCNVEDTQLRDLERIKKWATFMASIAMRAQRLKHLARTTPDVPASTEFSRDEIDAVILLYQPRGYRPGGRVPTLGKLVLWIAELGGYSRWSGGPPGQIVISRGMLKVEAAATALAAQREFES